MVWGSKETTGKPWILKGGDTCPLCQKGTLCSKGAHPEASYQLFCLECAAEFDAKTGGPLQKA